MIDYKKYRSGRILSGVNITPFTDVVLVLLIVFMITAPGILTSSLDIQLPDAGSSSSTKSEGITVALDREGRVYLDGDNVELKDLKALIRKRIESDPSGRFLLNADRKVEHGKVIEVLDLIRSSGAKTVLVGTVRQ